MGKFEFTPMMTRYLFKFAFRIAVFLFVFAIYLFADVSLWDLANQPLIHGITPMHVLWLTFMGIMLSHIFPGTFRTMALKKADKEVYKEETGYSELEMLRFVQDQNRKAWIVMLVWLIGNGVIGFFYLLNLLDRSDLLMFTVFFFLCDYICILVFCPFQTCIMKNKCCTTCRIFNWDHLMMFSPLIFVGGFYSVSLVVMALLAWLVWELCVMLYPERFWDKSNLALKCSECTDKLCTQYCQKLRK